MRGRISKRGLIFGVVLIVMAAGVLMVVGCQGAEEAEAEQEPAPTMADRRIDALASELELDEDQRQRLETIRDTVHERRDAMRAERDEAIEEHLEALESGEIDADEVHARIDEKVDEVRGTIHEVADQIIALVETMDDEQRARAASKLRTFHERMSAFHEQMEAEGGGPAAFLNHVREHVCAGHDPLFGEE